FATRYKQSSNSKVSFLFIFFVKILNVLYFHYFKLNTFIFSSSKNSFHLLSPISTKNSICSSPPSSNSPVISSICSPTIPLRLGKSFITLYILITNPPLTSGFLNLVIRASFSLTSDKVLYLIELPSLVRASRSYPRYHMYLFQ